MSERHTMFIFESVASGKLTPEQAAALMMQEDRERRRERSVSVWLWSIFLTLGVFVLAEALKP